MRILVACGALRPLTPGVAPVRVRRLAVLLWACASAGALASPAAGADYVHTVVRGETIYGIAQRLLEAPAAWQALQQRNGIADPTRLKPGQALRVPVAWLRREAAPASVIAAEGDASAVVGGARSTLAAGAALPPGAQVVTGGNGAVALRLADGTRLRVQAATEVELARLQRVIQTGTFEQRLVVRQGRLDVDAAPQKGPAAKLEIETPRAVAGVRGTDFRVGASDRASLVEVLAGAVETKGSGRGAAPIDLRGGEGVAYDAAGAPRVVPLLPAPEFDGLAATQVEPSVAIRVTAVDGAIGYRFQLALDPRFDRVIDERVAEAAEYRTPDLPDGGYSIAARAIEGSGLEGRDVVGAFTVAARPRPPFSLVGPDAGKGRAKDARFEWTGAAGAVAYRFQLAGDASMTPLLREEPRVAATRIDVELPLNEADYHWRVASIDPTGRQGPWSEVFRFERRPQAAQLDDPGVGERELVLRWPGIDGGRYQVQMARDAAFTSDVRDYATTEPSLRLPRPPSGEHFVRVRDVDAAGHAGPWSDPQRLEIPVDFTPLLFLLLVVGAILL